MANDIVSEESLLGPALQALNDQEQKQVDETIKTAAKNFLNAISQAIEKRRQSFNSVEKVLEGTATSGLKISQIYAAMRQNTTLTQDLTIAQFTFETALNEFLDRKIHLIWIDTTTRKFYFADEITAQQVYAKGTKKSGGRAEVRSGRTMVKENILKSFDELPELLGDFGNRILEHQKLYTGLYQQVLQRWDKNTHDKNNNWYRAQVPKGSGFYPYRKTFYWWRSPKDYGHSEKMNQGNISEAYIHMLMNSYQEDSINLAPLSIGSLQDKVESYWLYMKNHSLLNNTPGITEGDVLLAGRESTQFAVKANKFNTAAIGPYITVAYNILNLDSYNTKAKILKQLPTIKEATNAIRDTIEVLKEEALKEAIK